MPISSKKGKHLSRVTASPLADWGPMGNSGFARVSVSCTSFPRCLLFSKVQTWGSVFQIASFIIRFGRRSCRRILCFHGPSTQKETNLHSWKETAIDKGTAASIDVHYQVLTHFLWFLFRWWMFKRSVKGINVTFLEGNQLLHNLSLSWLWVRRIPL